MDILNDSVMGVWSIPGKSDSECEGTLIKNANGVYVLKTINCFDGLNDIHTEKIAIINGFTENGKKITLLNCSKPNQQINMPGMIVSEFSPLYIIVGAEYSSENEICCNEVSAEFNGLETWLEIRPFQIFKIPETPEIHLNYSIPQKQSWKLQNCEIGFDFQADIKSNSYSEFNILQSQKIYFTGNNMSFDDLLNKVYDFASFLTLCMGTKTIPMKMCGMDNNGQRIQIIENTTLNSNLSTKLKPLLFITYTDIRESFGVCIENWYSKKELLMPVIQRFVEIHEASHNIVSSFLKIVQALETFSRRMRHETVLPAEEHEQRLGRILGYVSDKKDYEWLSKVFETPILNEPSFQSRITKLLKETAFAFSVSKGAFAKLAYKIATTRNYYTHFNESLVDKIFSDHDMFYTIIICKFVIRVLLMKELGIREEQIKERIGCDTEIGYALSKLKLTEEMKLFDMKIIPSKQEDKM
ncbi:MAG TPA: hypothetical protein DIW17_18615 [Clostridiales bacterium]|nr:hypothetical protein [Clostridiales bacterium]